MTNVTPEPQPKMNWTSEAYLIGCDDRLDGKSLDDCPYDNSDEAKDWCEGWSVTDADLDEKGD